MTMEQEKMKEYLLHWREYFSKPGRSFYMVGEIDKMIEESPTSIEPFVQRAEQKKQCLLALANGNKLNTDHRYWVSCHLFVLMMHNMLVKFGSFENIDWGAQ